MATVPDFQQASPNQQSLILECSICAEQYGPDFNNQPRSLRCGHTFCTSCLMKIISSRGVPCPVCSLLHPLPNPDVMLLPINYAVQEIMKNLSATGSNSQDAANEQQVATCGVCSLNPATVVCVDCDPGKHFRFCAGCDRDEHSRPFGPVMRHKRFPLSEAPAPPNTIFCSRHPQETASLYSEASNEFACGACQLEGDWAGRAATFEPIIEATQRMRVKVQKLTKYINVRRRELSDSKQNMEMILNSLEPASMTVKANITRTFSKLTEILQERQRKLQENVDVELKNRSESLKKQYDTVIRTNIQYRDAFESLSSLISKSDVDFLQLFRNAIPKIEALVDAEDKSLLRPLVNQDIPFYLSKDVEKQLLTLGAVGGGLTPIDLECSPNGPQGTLLELLWQLPKGCGKLNRFQVEYEQLQDGAAHRRSGILSSGGSGGGGVVGGGGGGGGGGGDMCYVQSDPQFYEVPGNELNAYVDYLCPGYSYQFRIRSANDAGFGMWSDPVVGQCADFPYVLQYISKRIHRIIIPVSGYYRITVKGAKAADGMCRRGGRGAILAATFSLKAGNVLIMLVGGMSYKHHYNSGGGGGSFVALNEMTQDSLLMAAGGGGGTRGADANDFDGLDANLYEDGLDGVGSEFGRGGKGGGPGEDAKDYDSPSWGCGGAGFMQDSSTALSFVAGGHAGQNGGFGGGGAVGMYGGGGGGGYSGGGGGRGGGGGGSYVVPTATEVTRELGNEGHGSIVIEKVDPPYPISNQFLNRELSTAGSTTESVGSSSTHLSEKGGVAASAVSVPAGALDAQSSSSSLSTRAAAGSVNGGSSSGAFGVIPETDSESFQQSPASTSQVMDHPDTGGGGGGLVTGPPSTAVFTLDDDDVEIMLGETPTAYQTNVKASLQTNVARYNTILAQYNEVVTASSGGPTPSVTAPTPMPVNEVYSVASSAATCPLGAENPIVEFQGGASTNQLTTMVTGGPPPGPYLPPVSNLVDTSHSPSVKEVIETYQTLTESEKVATLPPSEKVTTLPPSEKVTTLPPSELEVRTMKQQEIIRQQSLLLLDLQRQLDSLRLQQEASQPALPPAVAAVVPPPQTTSMVLVPPAQPAVSELPAIQRQLLQLQQQLEHLQQQQQQQQQQQPSVPQVARQQVTSPPLVLQQQQQQQQHQLALQPGVSPPLTQQQQQLADLEQQQQQQQPPPQAVQQIGSRQNVSPPLTQHQTSRVSPPNTQHLQTLSQPPDPGASNHTTNAQAQNW